MFPAAGLSLRPEREVTEHDRKKFIKVFHACDRDNNGYLNREDLKVAVVMLFGYKPTKLEVNSMTSSLTRTAGVTLEEFLQMMTIKKAAQLSIGDHRQIFSVFDVHCRGYLTVDDFKRAFKLVCPRMREQTVVEAFREVDRDADGMVCYRDFESAVSYGEEEE